MRPSVPALPLVALALAACDPEAGRSESAPGSACVAGKCEDPNAGDPQQNGQEEPVRPCDDGMTSEQRIEACHALFPTSSLWTRPRPAFDQPYDTLYYVNRWHSIDPCFVDLANSGTSGISLRLAQEDFRHIEESLPDELLELPGVQRYGQRLVAEPNPDTWIPCSQRPAFTARLVTPDGWVVSVREDAWRSLLPEGFSPPDHGYFDPADGTVIQGFHALFLAAREQDIVLSADSGYRSAETQKGLFESYTGSYGVGQAETFSAHPLHSEHQLGTAIDMRIDGYGDPKDDYGVRLAFAESDKLAWVRDNAHRFGVVLSYPVDRVDEHQYVPEPWHFRYVGVEAATIMHGCGLSTEELMQAMYGDELPPLPEFEGMENITQNLLEVGYDEASCWYR